MHSTIGCDPSSTCSFVELRVAEFWNGGTELPGENLDEEGPIAIHDSRIEYCWVIFPLLSFSYHMKGRILTLKFLF